MTAARSALLALAVCAVCWAEVAVAGSDKPGFAHDASIVMWLAGAIALLAALLCAAAGIRGTVRQRRREVT